MAGQIVRHPDDDSPRLAYADAVAAEDPERAEFIRLQIARFRGDAARGASSRPGPREAALRTQHGARWAQAIAPYARAPQPGSPFQGYEFERGFVARLRTEPAIVASMGDRLVSLAPIEHLELTAAGPFLPAFAAPCLGQMRSLAFNQLGLGDDDAVALAERGHLDRCEWLSLRGNQIGSRGIAALLASPKIRRIPVVMLHGNRSDPTVQVSQDLDGGVLVHGLPPDSEAAEARYGRIAWLHIPPFGPGQPDRFHPRGPIT